MVATIEIIAGRKISMEIFADHRNAAFTAKNLRKQPWLYVKKLL